LTKNGEARKKKRRDAHCAKSREGGDEYVEEGKGNSKIKIAGKAGG